MSFWGPAYFQGPTVSFRECFYMFLITFAWFSVWSVEGKKPCSTFFSKRWIRWIRTWCVWSFFSTISHRIHVWYIYLHLPYKSTIHVGKYTSPMDCLGNYGKGNFSVVFGHVGRLVATPTVWRRQLLLPKVPCPLVPLGFWKELTRMILATFMKWWLSSCFATYALNCLVELV